MFHSARIKLTFWYVIIATVITGFFSVLIYSFVTTEFDHELHRERMRIERSLTPTQGIPTHIIIRQPDPELVTQMHNRILFRILTIDVIIVAIAALAGYLLAGRTLRPIKRIMEEQDRFISDASHELRTPLTAARTEIGGRRHASPPAVNLFFEAVVLALSLERLELAFQKLPLSVMLAESFFDV